MPNFTYNGSINTNQCVDGKRNFSKQCNDWPFGWMASNDVVRECEKNKPPNSNVIWVPGTQWVGAEWLDYDATCPGSKPPSNATITGIAGDPDAGTGFKRTDATITGIAGDPDAGTGFKRTNGGSPPEAPATDSTLYIIIAIIICILCSISVGVYIKMKK